MQLSNGIFTDAEFVNSDHADQRPDATDISVLVIHNISLPPGQFGGPYVQQLFTGSLSAQAHPFFNQIHQLRVSAHLFIRRDGTLVQFVPLHRRAWHAGVSSFQGRTNCNDYSIGIELEGTDDMPYTSEQYQVLSKVTVAIMRAYPAISLGRIVGHLDIAPGRKTDPGVSFAWTRFRSDVMTQLCR